MHRVQERKEVVNNQIGTFDGSAASMTKDLANLVLNAEGNADIAKADQNRNPNTVNEADIQRSYKWNEEYDLLLHSANINGEVAQGFRVSAFLKTFFEAAEALVYQIIGEMVLNDDIKTQRPQKNTMDDQFLSTDGIHQIDWLQEPLIHRYHGNGLILYVHVGSGSHEDALEVIAFHKLMGHQIRAARALHDMIESLHNEAEDSPLSHAEALRIPLQCTVDYLGHRMYVIASSQAYMTSMRAVASSRESKSGKGTSYMQNQLKGVCDRLGLMTDTLCTQHINDDNENEVCADGTLPAFFPISAGISTSISPKLSTTYWLQNVYDLFPVDVQTRGHSNGVVRMSAIECALFKMRPEFVRQHGEMLLFHANAHVDPSKDLEILESNARQTKLESHLLQQAAISAGEYLQSVIVPSFVRSLEENKIINVFDSDSLTHALHAEGINIRYLGLCYELATAKHIRRLFFTEMLARACKVEFRASLRTLVHETSQLAALRSQSEPGEDNEPNSSDEGKDLGTEANEETTRQVAQAKLRGDVHHMTLTFFNLVFGVISSLDARMFWKDRILPQIWGKFGGHNVPPTLEALMGDDVIHLPQLFHAVQVQINLRFDDHMHYNFKAIEPFNTENLVSISPITKLLARTAIKCEHYLEQSDELVADGKYEEALASIKLHLSILDTVSTGDNKIRICHLLTCAADLCLLLNDREKAEQFAFLAVEDGPKNHAIQMKAHTVCMKAKYMVGDIEAARMHFANAIAVGKWHLGSAHPFFTDTYLTMMEILYEHGVLQEAQEVLNECVHVTRECFGKASLVYADIRRKQGTLLFENRAYEEAIGVLEDVIAVYERYFQDPIELATTYKILVAACYYLKAAIYMDTNSTKANRNTTTEAAYNAALQALSLRKEVLPRNHVDLMNSYLQLGALAKELGDRYRALECFRPALGMLKQMRDEERADEIRSVTELMLQLHLESLSTDKLHIIEKTRKRFASHWPRFDQANPTVDLHSDQNKQNLNLSGAASTVECELLTFVMKELFLKDPIDYANALVEKTDQELQEYRKQYTLGFAGTLRNDTMEVPSPEFKRMQSPTAGTSRFASFSFSGESSGSSSIIAPTSPKLALSPGAATRRMSISQVDTNFLITTSGDFTFGGQLAALLYLVDQAVQATASPLSS